MAPIISKKRTSLRKKTAASERRIHEPRIPLHANLSHDSTGFLASKRDKRLIKHSAFVNRIEKVHGPAGAGKKRTRRPSRKLVTTLEDLVDALPDVDTSEGGRAADADGQAALDGARVKIRQHTVKTRPGAMKRKERAEKLERERFDRNLAQLMSVDGVGQKPVYAMADDAGVGVSKDGVAAHKPAPTPAPNRWAALRGFMSQTLEQKEDFKGVV